MGGSVMLPATPSLATKAAALHSSTKKNNKPFDYGPPPSRGSTPTALDEYVYRDDGMFSVTDLKTSYPGDGFNIHMYNFTSQKWLTPADSSQPVWWHILAVIIPDGVDKTLDSAFMYITGNHNSAGWLPSPDDEDLMVATALAVGAKTTAAVLFQVPNEGITFPDDPWHHPGRTEDAAIAYTWWHYIARERNPEWILELPMTKAGVKALDALQQIIPQYIGGQKINQFSIAGASKRGWTTWLVGAVEAIRPNNRVMAIIPMVLDAVNVHAFLHRQFTFYGAWTFALIDYVACNITQLIDTDGLREVFETVDMWYYLDRLTMPKVILNAGGDEFQMPDDHRYFGKYLPGESKFLLVKNAEHSLATGLPEVLSAGIAFISSVQKRSVRPTIDWSIEESTGRIFVNTSAPPKMINLTYSDSGLGVSKGRRDFRWAAKNVQPCVGVFGGCVRPLLWETEGLEHVVMTSPTSFNALVSPIEGQWRVFTLEITFDSPDSTEPLLFTVPASVVPFTTPFPDCSGAECGSTMC